jgi:hypothetical protein
MARSASSRSNDVQYRVATATGGGSAPERATPVARSGSGALAGHHHEVAKKKYDPLFAHLCRLPDGPVEVSMDEIDQLVGGLPPTASRHRSWWGNEPGGRNVQASAWLNAGREVTNVDLGRRVVAFSAAQWRRGS